MQMPRLYAIADAEAIANPLGLIGFYAELLKAGVTLIQYRNKSGTAREILSQAEEMRRTAPANVRLIMNDRADLCVAASFDGVHLGQHDLSVAGARMLCKLPLLVGISTHNPDQVAGSATNPDVDYIALGPVFATKSKSNPEPVIGLEGIRQARALTKKTLVAIGGITRANCRQVIEAGADSVAVISDLLIESRKAAAEFLEILS